MFAFFHQWDHGLQASADIPPMESGATIPCDPSPASTPGGGAAPLVEDTWWVPEGVLPSEAHWAPDDSLQATATWDVCVPLCSHPLAAVFSDKDPGLCFAT